MSSLVASWVVAVKQGIAQIDQSIERIKAELVGRKCRIVKHPNRAMLGSELRIKNILLADRELVVDLGIKGFPKLDDVEVDYGSKPASAAQKAGE